MPSKQRQGNSAPFQWDLISSYVDAPHFVRRRWIEEQLEAAVGADCSFVLLTAEPGAGKTPLTTGLARLHPDWLHYFIRSDSGRATMDRDAQSSASFFDD